MRGSRIFELYNGAVTENAQGIKCLELGTLHLGVSVLCADLGLGCLYPQGVGVPGDMVVRSSTCLGGLLGAH